MTTIATAGHVDHGKSALIHALTGQDPDRLAEEKSRGLTIDLGFAWMELDSQLESESEQESKQYQNTELAFVDVPGHEKFVSNMLAGAASVDACLFVISAKEKMMPQSWEHLHILDLFGIPDGVVALTNVSGMKSEELDRIQADIASSLAGSFLQNAEIVRTDAPANTGIDELKEALKKLWHRLPPPCDLNNPRLWVDRSFVISGSGTVVTSTLTSGSVEVGDELVVLPANKKVKVRGVQSMGKERKKATPAMRTALNLTKITAPEIKRGDVLVKPNKWFQTKTFDASFSVSPNNKVNSAHNNNVNKLTEKGAYMVYLGSGDFRAHIAVLGKHKSIKAGEAGKIRIFLDTKLPLKLGDRFVIRDVGRRITLGGGEILDLDPQLKVSKANPGLTGANLEPEVSIELRDDMQDSSVERILSERGGWLKTKELELVAYPLLATPHADASYMSLGEWSILISVFMQLKEELLEKLRKAKDAGIKTSDCSEIKQEVLQAFAEVKIVRGKAYLKPDQTTKNATANENAEKNENAPANIENTKSHPYLKLLDESPFFPPAPGAHIEKEMLRDFVYQKFVIEADGVFFSVGAVQKAKEILAELIENNSEGVSVSEFKDALSTTRKYALALLGYFDSVGVSKRRGDFRIGGPRLFSLV